MTGLSQRVLRVLNADECWALLMKSWANPFSEDNPTGILSMGVAENKLMHKEIAEYLTAHLSVTSQMLTYGEGPSGSRALRDALSSFINNHFSPYPSQRVAFDQITVMNGIGSVLDALAYCIVEPGDGVLIARPLYVGFPGDLSDRSQAEPIFVSIGKNDITSLEAVKDHENALLAARANGTTVKALLLCNPHNPLGRCYSKQVLEAYLALCSKYSIHFISDEAYAKATFPSKDVADPLPFTSVLSLEIKSFIDPSLVHCLYGMSKDFSANGLRIGAFISLSNPELHKAMASIAKFSWASSLSDHAWTLLLLDTAFLETYFSAMTRKLTAAYELCTAALRELGIPYIPANCGPFIWLDLGAFLKERTIIEERKLANKMLDSGVFLATGESFISEVPGWFRITFAVSKEEFALGMDRLKKVLLQVESNFELKSLGAAIA